MHMLHMHISMDIIITLSFFITDFLLSSVLNGVSALDGGIVTLSAGFVNPLFYIPAICKKIRQQSPTVFVCFAARIILSYPPKHSLTCCAFTQRGMKKSHQAALDGSQSGTKASQNSPPAMAANNLDHFLPRRCVKKICRWHIFSIRSRRLCRRSIRLDFCRTPVEKARVGAIPNFVKKGLCPFLTSSNRKDTSATCLSCFSANFASKGGKRQVDG